MESLTWFLTFAILGAWLAVGIGIVRRPPGMPGPWNRSLRMLTWGVIWVGALLAGVWGPALWSTTRAAYPDDPSAGPPAETSHLVIRTPFAVQATSAQRDAESRLIHREDRLTLQLPIGLLLFFGLMAMVRRRERTGPADRAETHAAGAATLLLVLAAGCGSDGVAGSAPRADRDVLEVQWDTLLHVQLEVEDTLLYSADAVAASHAGIWIMDRIGYRVAHFDWEGRLRWYAGGRGAGPGEFVNPRVIGLDGEDRVWVLDLTLGRITGFGPDGRAFDDVSLQRIDGPLHDFHVSPGGDRFFGMLATDRLQPVSVDRDGRVERGPPIRVEAADGLYGIALQGFVSGSPEGNRWVYAFSMGDGLFRIDGIDAAGARNLYPEEVPFPTMTERITESDDRVTTTRTLAEPSFAAGSLAVTDDRIWVRFRGRTPRAGLLLDAFDLESGDYLETLLLPRAGAIAAWEERILLAWNLPAPGFMVLTRRE